MCQNLHTKLLCYKQILALEAIMLFLLDTKVDAMLNDAMLMLAKQQNLAEKSFF